MVLYWFWGYIYRTEDIFLIMLYVTYVIKKALFPLTIRGYYEILYNLFQILLNMHRASFRKFLKSNCNPTWTWNFLHDLNSSEMSLWYYVNSRLDSESDNFKISKFWNKDRSLISLYNKNLKYVNITFLSSCFVLGMIVCLHIVHFILHVPQGTLLSFLFHFSTLLLIVLYFDPPLRVFSLLCLISRVFFLNSHYLPDNC